MINLDWPTTVDEFIGVQQRTIAQAFLDSGVPQTAMFLGPSGIGKTSLANFAARCVLKDVEVVHLNCVDKSGVADARALSEELHLRPLGAKYRVYFLDEIHGWSGQAQEALLTKLEPQVLPDHVYIFAASTVPEKLKPTLVSRFTVYRLQVPTNREQATWLLSALEEHGFGVEGYNQQPTMLTKELASEVVYSAAGNLRGLKRLAQQIVTNTLTCVTEGDSEGPSLVDVFFQGKGNPFALAGGQPQTMLVGLCRYAQKVLSTNPESLVALRVLAIFGAGLPTGVPEDVGLAHLISLYLQSDKRLK